jgi:alcohol dehydrogenase class IV
MARPLTRLTNTTSHLAFSTFPRLAARSPAMESKLSPLTGLYQPNNLNSMYYGAGTVKAHLLDCLPSESSKAFIITGSSLANKTPLVKQVEELLGSKHHAGTFSKIGQHAPIKQLDEATDRVKEDPSIDTIISIGGGSPIDSAKAISYRLHEKLDKFLTHIAIPTSKNVFRQICALFVCISP